MASTKTTGTIEIIQYPDKRLSQQSVRVGYFTQEHADIIDSMTTLIEGWKRKGETAVAMAAIQIGEPVKIVIIRHQGKYVPFINPKIAKFYGDVVDSEEGCLSVEGQFKVKRYTKVKVDALNIDGKPVRLKAEGLAAFVWQHEIDHFSGKLVLDKQL